MPDPLTWLGAASTAAELANSIARLTGLVKTIEDKLGLLLQADFKSALENLEQASHSPSRERQRVLVEKARDEFNRAVGQLEDWPCKQAVALLGQASCYYWLGNEEKNAGRLLRRILSIDGTPSFKEIMTAELLRDAGDGVLGLMDFTGGALGAVSGALGAGGLVTAVAGTAIFAVPVVGQLVGVAAVVACATAGGLGGLTLSRVLNAGVRGATQDRKKLNRENTEVLIGFGGPVGELVRIQFMVAENLNETIPWVDRLGLQPDKLKLLVGNLKPQPGITSA